MATVLPMRPHTNSTDITNGGANGSGGASGSDGAVGGRKKQGSFSSFPSSAKRSDSTSTHNDFLSIPTQPSRLAPGSTLIPGTRPKQRPIKSQYPRGSMEKHVEYILVASFDIDRGSVMEHQYPGPVGGDEHMLAELMLPDQAHVRAQDWTIFFLHKDAADEEEKPKKQRRRRRRSGGERNGQSFAMAENDGYNGSSGESGDDDDWDSEGSDDDLKNMDGPPLTYVLNLVNTKHDTTTRRGAIVKAMAICTRHSFLHIYKPLLLLALEQYFAHPVIETLAELYEAVNSMDLSLLPKLTFHERAVLQSSEAKDLFVEKFEAIIAQRVLSADRSAAKALVPPSPTTQTSGRGHYGLPRDTHEFESVVKYANVPVPVKIPVALSAETVGNFSLIKLITTFSTPHTTSPAPFNPTHPHLTTSGPLTHPIIVLLNALLTQKRIIFLGHNLPSSEVAEAVLGACALASGGMLRGFTRYAFPYTDLTKIDDLLKVPGFIAGVTNPAFAHKTEWWDLLCDLPTGRIRISNRIEAALPAEGVAFFQHPQNNATHSAIGMSASTGIAGTTSSITGDPTGDGAFMSTVIAAIQERHGENAIRGKFRRWILKFTRLAVAFEETVYGASALHVQAPSNVSPRVDKESPGGDSPLMRRHQLSVRETELPPEVTGHGYVWSTPQAKTSELAANATRIEGWRNTRTYYNFIQDLAAYYVHRPVKELDLHHLHDQLAKLRLGQDISANVYLAICAAVNTDQEICQLLSVIADGSWDSRGGPGSQSQGLFYLALGLFHQRKEVREQVAELLLRIQDHEAGRHFWSGLGRFAKIGWERIMTTKESREDDGEYQ